jgi:hypothetical protein
MTNGQIEKYKQELCEIQRISNTKEKWEKLKVLAGKLHAPIPAGLHDDFTIDSINKITRNIHDSLQTEMMLNACVSAEKSCELAKQSSISAKWACLLAVMAAIFSAIGAIADWVTPFIK